MNRFEADRMRNIPFSGIRRVFERAEKMKAEGRRIFPLHIGRPDFDTPTHIKEAARAALDDGRTAYTSNYGIPALREAIARKLARDNNIRIDPDRQVIVTVGANEAVLMIMLGLLNPGDEVLVPDPSWLHYRYCATLAGAKVVPLPLVASNHYLPDPDDAARLVGPRTRMLIVNSPHNPTGMVLPEYLMKQLAELAERHNLILVSDEIYEKIIYGGSRHISPGAWDWVAHRTVTVNGFSKAYAMTGWRLGYVVASPEITDILVRVHQYTTVCATSFAQEAAVSALNGPQTCVEDMVADFNLRRQVLLEALAELPTVQLATPNGGFYAFPRIAETKMSSLAFAEALLEETGVAVVPGLDFGEFGEGHVRLSYACHTAVLKEGLDELGRFLRERAARAV